MKKFITGIAFVVISSAASADVELYGQIRTTVSAGQTKIKGSAGTEKSPVITRINDNTSRLGLKGNEKLGEGLTAVWQIEQRISTAGEDFGWGNRDSFVGLEGKFGKLRVGNISNQLNTMDDHDFWIYRTSALGLGIQGRTADRKVSVRYDTPAFAGFDANIQYSPRDNQNPDDAALHNEPSRAQLDAGVNYTHDSGMFAKFGYNMKKNRYTGSNGEQKDSHAARILGGYTDDKLFVGLGVQHTRGHDTANTYLSYFTNGFNTYNGADITQDAGKNEAVNVTDAALSASYQIGNWVPKITYAHGWAAKGVNSREVLVDKFDQIIIGGDYKFSKRTSLRGQIGHLRTGGQTRLAGGDTGKVQQTAAQFGLHHRF